MYIVHVFCCEGKIFKEDTPKTYSTVYNYWNEVLVLMLDELNANLGTYRNLVEKYYFLHVVCCEGKNLPGGYCTNIYYK